MQTQRKTSTNKKGLDLEWEQEHRKSGRYTLDMVRIDHL